MNEHTLEERVESLEMWKGARLEIARTLWMCLRQALIIALGGIEDFLGLERSIVPRRKR